jgi:hypothetical protein
MKYLCWSAALVAATALLLATPTADAVTARSSAPVSGTVALRLASISFAATEARLASQRITKAEDAAVTRAMPAAVAEVEAAAAQGPEAVGVLISRLEHSASAWKTRDRIATTPSEYALGLALEPYASVAVSASVLRGVTTDASSSCWFVGSYVGYRWTFKEAGKPVAWIEEDHNFWCGNGSRITQNGLAFYDRQWEQFPFCVSVTDSIQGWDAPYHSWAHGGIWASQGIWTPWGTCGTYQSGHAVVRIAANGYFDFYNDF